jgi:diguanylate cyclase (GGDEF)-like protein
MTSIDGTEGGTRRPGLRAWPIWQLTPRLRWPILVVELTAVLLVVLGLLDRPVPGREDLVALVVLGGLGLAHTELSRDVERVRWRLTGDLHVDLTSVWVFAAAAAIAPGYAALLAATVHTYLWLRSARTRAPPHRQVFSTATIVLSCLAAAAVMHHVRAQVPLLDAPGGMLAALLLGMLVFLTVNSALVAGAIAISTADHADVGELLGEWDENLVEVAALALGAMVATVLAINAWLVPFVLPPLLVLQRAALVRMLEEAANLDPKTGLLNAAAWHVRAQDTLARTRPAGGPQAVLVLDLDHFKQVNDRHGHLAGDQVLVAVAAALRTELRDGDLVGRFGGEEFVLLLAGQAGGTLADLESVADRVRHRIAGLHVQIPTPDGPLTIAGLTVSVGGAIRTEQADLTSLLHIADTALYAAKRAGRDQVRMSHGQPGAAQDQPEHQAKPAAAQSTQPHPDRGDAPASSDGLI